MKNWQAAVSVSSSIATYGTKVCLESPRNMAIMKSCETFSIVLYRTKTSELVSDPESNVRENVSTMIESQKTLL